MRGLGQYNHRLFIRVLAVSIALIALALTPQIAKKLVQTRAPTSAASLNGEREAPKGRHESDVDLEEEESLRANDTVPAVDANAWIRSVVEGSRDALPQTVHELEDVSSFPDFNSLTVATPLFSRTEVNDYAIREGDTLGSIAERVYGKSAFWRELARVNSIDAPYTIHTEQVIKIPRMVGSVAGEDKRYTLAHDCYHRGDYANAERVLEHLLVLGLLSDQDRPKAMFLAAKSHLRQTQFYEWRPEFFRRVTDDSPEYGHLQNAKRWLTTLIEEYKGHRLADDAARELAGIRLRSGEYVDALTGYREIPAQWPSGDVAEKYLDQDLQWCLVAMAARLNALDVNSRACFIREILLRGARDLQRLLQYRIDLLRGLSSDEFSRLGREVDDDDIVEAIFYGEGINLLPLRIRGYGREHSSAAMNAAEWLYDIGEFRECEALCSTIWREISGEMRRRFASVYTLALLQQNKATEAIEVARQARLNRTLWVILGNCVPLEVLRTIAESDSEASFEDPLLAQYLYGLRLYAARRYKEAWEVFWSVSVSGHRLLGRYACVRLFELYWILRCEDIREEWSTTRQAIMSSPASSNEEDEPNYPYDGVHLPPLYSRYMGADTSDLTDAEGREMAEHFWEYDRIESSLWGNPRHKKKDINYRTRIRRLVRDVIGSSYYAQFPAAAKAAMENLDDTLRLQEDRWNSNMWRDFADILFVVVAPYFQEIGCSGEDEFKTRMAPVLDLCWNLLRLRSISGPSDGAASHLYTLGQYFSRTDPFAMPGLGREDSRVVEWLAGPSDPPDDVMASRLHGAHLRIAEACFRKADALAPKHQDILYSLAICCEQQADLLLKEQDHWQSQIVHSFRDARLISSEVMNDILETRLPPSFRYQLPRWQFFSRHAREAIKYFERCADLDLNLRDDALGHAAELADSGLGEVDKALAYYQMGIEVDGDQRALLVFLRDALFRRQASGEMGDPRLSIASFILGYFIEQARQPGDDARTSEKLDSMWVDAPLAAYVQLQRAFSSGELDVVPELLVQIMDGGWAHPLCVYLCEKWAANTRTAHDKDTFYSFLAEKLASDDLGTARFYVELLAARLAISLEKYDQAEELVKQAYADSPFSDNPAIAFEHMELASKRGTPTAEQEQVPSLDSNVRYLYLDGQFVSVEN